MIFTVLSSFDNRIGPVVFLKAPERYNSIYLDHVPLLMDLYKEGFFVHEFGDLRTANLIFEIPSTRARGRREILMISIISYQEEFYLDLSSFQEILTFFALQMRNIKDVYKGFHTDEVPEGKEMYTYIVDLVFSFHDALPTERQLHDQMFSQVLTLKLSPEGKASILNNLQQKFCPSNQTNFNIHSLADIKF
ncbi:MAG: hypothetical protein ACTSR8_08360 [Promethearchaeota archaeon]